ncbi:thioredoxin family protein [Leptolyngbya sp. PCC 6406]|uniref:thioredoxin family protein n=1 Tax=Leptolyngbya sp. PCC 6406 TaxID=1173264 RepID=UPI0002AC5DEC|nr:thioredoxin domain-containing protein [Leptolyngbya sp. PCC 6406]
MSLSVNEATFDTEVLNASRPVLVHFWAPWCGICRMIEPLLQSFQNEWSGQVGLVDINADENLKLANQYRLTTLPTLILFENGTTCHRLDSFRGKEDLRIALDGFMQSRQLDGDRLQLGWIRPYRDLSFSD